MGQHRERSRIRRLTVAEGVAGVRATTKPEEEPARKITINNYQEGAVKNGQSRPCFWQADKRATPRRRGD